MTSIKYDDDEHRKRREYMREWYTKRSDRVKAWSLRYRAAHLESMRAYDRERGDRPNNMAPERERLSKRASNVVSRAIKRGALVRPDIGECGHSGFIEAAHEDYSDPLIFRWLCRPCHRRWDRLDPKTIPGRQA